MDDQTTINYFHEEHLNEEGIAYYVDALNSDSLGTVPEIILLHVEDCHKCKKKIIFINQVISRDKIAIDDFKYQFPDTMPEEHQMLLSKLMKIAAVAVFMVGIGGLAYYFLNVKSNSNIKNNVVVLKKDTTFKPIKDDKIDRRTSEAIVAEVDENAKSLKVQNDNVALSMRESKLFENLIASSLRSQEVKILAPFLNQHYAENDTISFELKKPPVSSLIIKIYNNRGDKVFEKEHVNVKKCKINTKLSSGLYYWKLEKNDDLIYIGKFIVDK